MGPRGDTGAIVASVRVLWFGVGTVGRGSRGGGGGTWVGLDVLALGGGVVGCSLFTGPGTRVFLVPFGRVVHVVGGGGGCCRGKRCVVCLVVCLGVAGVLEVGMACAAEGLQV